MSGYSLPAFENFEATDEPPEVWRVVATAPHLNMPKTFSNWFASEEMVRRYCEFRVLRGEQIVSIHKYRMEETEN